ncbi:DNA protecting protein DprA [Brevirhabdus pacifica]|uniref:DNA protecting protein DprA n=2 Tax=Brevirhabdus pacifica TaxID=1267768 RepID=A0A1U7DM67_9RHOB|nr:DNA protecting protein DprA [Brevirhabdus pacifica]OWU76905.1 DNA processing protein DprA [Loktanella sp. 22II-4b]
MFGALPPAPPRSEQEGLRWLQLIRSHKVGPATFLRLMAAHGDAGQALLALPDVARAAGLRDYRPLDPLMAEREYAAGRRIGARLLFLGGPGYPPELAGIADPPPVLWARGRAALAGRPAVALVGARNASSLGLRMARAMAGDLGRAGHAVVSGLARGIDAAAHEAALEHGTIAVLAGGIDVFYPSENAALAGRIATDGLLLSEQPVGTQPRARHFPRRNRIVSGLARAVVVIEAAARSGSLITARNALDQGREVLAVPGHPFEPRSGGCNMLLRDGATLVRDSRDVLEGLPPLQAATRGEGTYTGQSVRPLPQADRPVTPRPDDPPRTGAPPPPEAGELSRRILDRLGVTPMAEDDLVRELRLPTERVLAGVLDLELSGMVQRHSGGRLSKPG